MDNLYVLPDRIQDTTGNVLVNWLDLWIRKNFEILMTIVMMIVAVYCFCTIKIVCLYHKTLSILVLTSGIEFMYNYFDNNNRPKRKKNWDKLFIYPRNMEINYLKDRGTEKLENPKCIHFLLFRPVLSPPINPDLITRGCD